MGKLKQKFLTVFGDIKVQKWPPFLHYCPGDYYRVTGRDTDTIRQLLKPGDLLLRGYKDYLDGFFIPGKYSHTGVYAGNGKVIHAVAQGVCQCSLTDYLRCDKICVLRPKKGQKIALQRIHKWLGTPYDFDFKSDNGALYCHELAAQAYKELGVHKQVPYLGILRFKHLSTTYLAQSFLQNPNFNVVYQK